MEFNYSGKLQFKLHELIEYCERKKTVPDDEDEVFCGGYEYQVDEDSNIEFIRIFFTTKRLLSLSIKCNRSNI